MNTQTATGRVGAPLNFLIVKDRLTKVLEAAIVKADTTDLIRLVLQPRISQAVRDRIYREPHVGQLRDGRKPEIENRIREAMAANNAFTIRILLEFALIDSDVLDEVVESALKNLASQNPEDADRMLVEGYQSDDLGSDWEIVLYRAIWHREAVECRLDVGLAEESESSVMTTFVAIATDDVGTLNALAGDENVYVKIAVYCNVATPSETRDLLEHEVGLRHESLIDTHRQNMNAVREEIAKTDPELNPHERFVRETDDFGFLKQAMTGKQGTPFENLLAIDVAFQLLEHQQHLVAVAAESERSAQAESGPQLD